jgi:hypothetical protein
MIELGRFFRNERAQIAAAVIGFNAILGAEMWLFNQGLDQQRQYVTRIGRCFSQKEADEILHRPRVGTNGLLGEFLRERAQIRLVYTSARFADNTERERNRLRDQGHDVTSSPAEGIASTGQVIECRVTIKHP